MKNILVTGAYGFIGRNIALSLFNEGNKVFGIGRGSWNSDQASKWGFSSWLSSDINSTNLNKLFKGYGAPDLIYNCSGSSSVVASMLNPSKSLKDTVIGCSELLEWLKINSPKSRTVFISSAAVYGSYYERPILNNDAVGPISIYGAHKLISENLCKHYANQFDLKIVIPRIFSVYGAGLKKQLIWDFCEKTQTQNNIVLGGSGEEKRDWIEIRDLVKALSSLSDLASYEAPTLNIASGKPSTVKNIIDLIKFNFSESYDIDLNVSFDGKNREGNPKNLTTDYNELNKLNFSPEISLEKGISDYVSWYMDKNKEYS